MADEYTYNDTDYSFNQDDYEYNTLGTITLDQTVSTIQDSYYQAGANGQQYVSQEITCGLGGPLSQVDLNLKKVGDTVTFYVEIWDDSGGEPNEAISGSTLFSTSVLTTSYAWTSIAITNPPTVSNGSNVYIVVREIDADNSNHMQWGVQISPGNPYAGGIVFYGTDGSTWDTNVSLDLNVKSYVTV